MISNYHTASSGPGSTYYTFGFDDDGLGPTQGAAKEAPKKAGRRGMRGFKAWGRGRGSGATHSSDTISDNSQGVQSLSYSTGSSVQSAGETTASTEFSGMLKALDEADQKDANKARYYTRGPASVSSSLNYSDSETSYSGRGKLTRGTSVNSNLSTDYSTDQESQLEGTKLISVLLDEPINKPIPTILGPTDFSSDEEDEQPFDMRFEAARSPKHRRSNRKVAPAMERTNSKSSQSGRSVTSQEKQVVATKRSKVPVAPSDTTAAAPPPTTTTGSPPPTPTPEPTQQEQQQQLKQKQQIPQQTQDPVKQKTQSRSKDRSKPFSSCGLEMIEENIPANVKSFLRPFLCGVL